MARVLFLDSDHAAREVCEAIGKSMEYRRLVEHYRIDAVQRDPAIQISRLLGNTQPTAVVVCLTRALEDAGIVERVVKQLTGSSTGLIVSPRAWDAVREFYDPSWCLFTALLRKPHEVFWNVGTLPPGRNHYLGDDENPLERPIRQIAHLLDEKLYRDLYPKEKSVA